MRSHNTKLKLFVLITFTGLTVLAFTFGRGIVGTSLASISGPPSTHTGAPGELTCTDCHNPASGVGQFSIIAPANYTPGQVYQLTVRHLTSDTTRKRWGFEMTALANGAMAGTFANLNANTHVISGSGRSYIEHTTAGTFQNQTGGATWTMNWTAPATNVGPVTFYAAGIQANNNGSESGDQTYLTNAVVQPPVVTVTIHHGFSDFDGDGKADPSIYRPSDGFWYVNQSTAGFKAIQWGSPTDRLVPGDWDGDDKTDFAVWREDVANVASFYILQSATNTLRTETFGQTGDDPLVVADWDGDGKADPAVYREDPNGGQSYFFYRGSLNNPNGNITYLPWGTTGDKAMRGDFDGDGKADLAVFRQANATWYIMQSSNGTIRYEAWGLPTDKFVPADYDGDSKTDIAVFRAGVWYIKQSSTGTGLYLQWGLDTDTLVPADYDGDGKADAAVFRNGTWYIRSSGSGNLSVQNFGQSSDRPIENSYVK